MAVASVARDYNARSYLKTVFWFFLMNSGVSVLINYAYILLAPGSVSPLSRLFVHGALLSNVALVYLVLGGLMSIGAVVPKRGSWFLGVAVIAVTVLHMLNILDIIIFRIFRYHINSMVLVLVFTEGARDSLHIGFTTVLTYAAVASGFIGFEAYLVRYCSRHLSLVPFTGKAIRISLIASLIFVFADKATYAVSDLYNINEVTRYTKVFPLYQRVTIKRFMTSHFGFNIDKTSRLNFSNAKATLSYPLEPLKMSGGRSRPNIICIIIDAWRFDMLNEQVSPNIQRFSREAVVFKNHRSGGNASRFGVYTLIYGVYGRYWHPFLAERQGPVLFDELIRLGYDFKILSSSKLTNPEFRKTAFIKLHPYINDTLPGKESEERDPELAQAFITWLDERDTGKPFYSFLFFDAPHGPYRYPDAYEKFKPSNKNPNYITTGTKDAVALRNSYMNAIYFDDSLIGTILDTIRKKGLLENTLIMITGDHGEEFYESGFWGHTSSFSKYQTQVPLVLYIPGKPHEEITTLTSHLDMTPTILEMLGCETPSPAFSQGQNIFTPGGHPYVVVSGWSDCAVIDEEDTIVLPTETYNAGSSEVRSTRDYSYVPDERAVFRKKQDTILAVMQQMSIFLR